MSIDTRCSEWQAYIIRSLLWQRRQVFLIGSPAKFRWSERKTVFQMKGCWTDEKITVDHHREKRQNEEETGSDQLSKVPLEKVQGNHSIAKERE